MKLRPLGDRVIVERLSSEKKSPGGVVIPDNAQQKSQLCKVVAVGPGQPNLSYAGEPERFGMYVKVGDTVVISRYGGNEIEIEGEEYLILRMDEIQAILD